VTSKAIAALTCLIMGDDIPWRQHRQTHDDATFGPEAHRDIESSMSVI
jgi:hypothetical protein